ncbi:UDP-glucuronosyl/UDP-glucosyltransferase [Corchorus olitorius]|uniref:UDP-glucuronosyl/UDP-glucosyltransferase n=1 Tax=Corchorus olitorius TaxID=93759 RepID=A0A1R3K676_9ROSI|nr:UDP-glucuronosyl/UDP-glucosyltransferase [Corchorus olitorius]
MNKTSTVQGLSYASFSDGYDQGFKQGTDDLNHYMVEIKRCGSQTLREFIAKSINQGTKFACVVYCTLLPWVPLVAREFQIPTTFLWNQTATVLNIYHHSFKGYDNSLLSHNDLPVFLIPSNPCTLVLAAFKEHFEILDQETKPIVLVNSIDALEAEAMKDFVSYKSVGIGPLLKDPLETSSEGDLFHVSKEYKEMKWLNSKPESSVIYVSFGTLSVLSKAQMEELAKGLLETGRPFIWVIKETKPEEEEGLSWVRVRKNEEGLLEGFELKRCLDLVMGNGETGEEIRRNATKWKELTRAAAMENGASDKKLKAFVDGLFTSTC